MEENNTIKISQFDTTTELSKNSMFPLIMPDGNSGWDNYKVSIQDLKRELLTGVATSEDLEEIANQEVPQYTILTSYALSDTDEQAPSIVQTDEAYTPRFASNPSKRWSKTDLFKGVTKKQYLWTTQARVENKDGETIYYKWDEINVWSDPVCLGQYDHIGFDTDKYNYVYCNIEKPLEEIYAGLRLEPTASLSFTVEQVERDKTSVDTITNIAWSDNRFAVTKSKPYEYCKVAERQADGSWGAFSKYFLMSHFGKDGKDGDNIEYIFYLSSEKLDEQQIADKLYTDFGGMRSYNITVDGVQQSVTKDSEIYQDKEKEFIPDGWTDNAGWVSSSYPYQYMSLRKSKDEKWSDFSAPTIWNMYNDAMYVKGYQITVDNDNWSVTKNISTSNLERLTTATVNVTNDKNVALTAGVDYTITPEDCEFDGVILKVRDNNIIYLTSEEGEQSVQLEDSGLVSFKVHLIQEDVTMLYTINVTVLNGSSAYNLIVSPSKIQSSNGFIPEGTTIYISAYKFSGDSYELAEFDRNLKIVLYKESDTQHPIYPLINSGNTIQFDFQGQEAPKYFRVELQDQFYNVLDVETIYPYELAVDGVSSITVNMYNDSVTISPNMDDIQLKQASTCYFDVHYGGDILPVYLKGEVPDADVTLYAEVEIKDEINTDESKPVISWDLKPATRIQDRTAAYIYLEREHQSVPLSATSATLNVTVREAFGSALDTAAKQYLVKADKEVYNLQVFPQFLSTDHDCTKFTGNTVLAIDIESFDNNISNLVINSKLRVTPYSLNDQGNYVAGKKAEQALYIQDNRIKTTRIDMIPYDVSRGTYFKIELVQVKNGEEKILDWETIELNPDGAKGESQVWIKFDKPTITIPVDMDGKYNGEEPLSDLVFTGTVYNGSEELPYEEYTDDMYNFETLDRNQEGVWVYFGETNSIGNDANTGQAVSEAMVTRVNKNGSETNSFRITIPARTVQELFLASGTKLLTNYLDVFIRYHIDKNNYRTVSGTLVINKNVAGRPGIDGLGSYPTYIKNDSYFFDDDANDTVIGIVTKTEIRIQDAELNQIASTSQVTWEISKISFVEEGNTVATEYDELKVNVANGEGFKQFYMSRNPEAPKTLKRGNGEFTIKALVHNTTPIEYLVKFRIMNYTVTGESYLLTVADNVYNNASQNEASVDGNIIVSLVGTGGTKPVSFTYGNTGSSDVYVTLSKYTRSGWTEISQYSGLNPLHNLAYDMQGYRVSLYVKGQLIEEDKLNCVIDPSTIAVSNQFTVDGYLTIGLKNTESGGLEKGDAPYLNFSINCTKENTAHTMKYTFKNFYGSGHNLEVKDDSTNTLSRIEGHIGKQYQTSEGTKKQSTAPSCTVNGSPKSIPNLQGNFYISWLHCDGVLIEELAGSTKIHSRYIACGCESGYYFQVDDEGLRSIQSNGTEFSGILQEANDIKTYVNNTAAGLRSEIDQKANSLALKLSDLNDGLTKVGIDLKLDEGPDAKGEITLTADTITANSEKATFKGNIQAKSLEIKNNDYSNVKIYMTVYDPNNPLDFIIPEEAGAFEGPTPVIIAVDEYGNKYVINLTKLESGGSSTYYVICAPTINSTVIQTWKGPTFDTIESQDVYIYRKFMQIQTKEMDSVTHTRDLTYSDVTLEGGTEFKQFYFPYTTAYGSNYPINLERENPFFSITYNGVGLAKAYSSEIDPSKIKVVFGTKPIPYEYDGYYIRRYDSNNPRGAYTGIAAFPTVGRVQDYTTSSGARAFHFDKVTVYIYQISTEKISGGNISEMEFNKYIITNSKGEVYSYRKGSKEVLNEQLQKYNGERNKAKYDVNYLKGYAWDVYNAFRKVFRIDSEKEDQEYTNFLTKSELDFFTQPIIQIIATKCPISMDMPDSSQIEYYFS